MAPLRRERLCAGAVLGGKEEDDLTEDCVREITDAVSNTCWSSTASNGGTWPFSGGRLRGQRAAAEGGRDVPFAA